MKIRQSFVWDKEIKDKVEKLAAVEKRSISQMIQILLERAITKPEG
ncbi:MAG TPA: hypothetical protein ENI07_10045 [Desulfobacterales bacterium]|nr:hypothetical protein [Desulfobacterales bacterium]